MHHIQHPHPTHSGVDMTEGNITGHLIRFALPLLAGNIFQQLYNMVDTWVVGNFVSNEAFSAVGTVGPIVNMLIGCFLGFSSGAGVVISQYYGARRTERVHDAVHTALVLTVILCAVFTALGIGFTPLMLRLMNTPAEVFPESSAYLTIYFGGISGLLIYNMGSGILRAVGDSRRHLFSGGLRRTEHGAGPAIRAAVRYGCGGRGMGYGYCTGRLGASGDRCPSANGADSAADPP